MIQLSNYSMDELSIYIKKNRLNIIVYGAGMIGKVIVPDYIMRKGLIDNIDFYVDIDDRKHDKYINIGNKACRIYGLDSLRNISGRHLLMITNSNFNPVLNTLDGMEEIDNIEAVIIPITLAMEAERKKNRYNIISYSKELIPKVIHYCWFSGKAMPDYLKKCMESWNRYCPDYEIKRWDESNYDIDKNVYMKQAYEEKKWGFVPDFARLDILYKYGGFYLDTDVELIRPLEELRSQMAFCGVEKWGNINLGGCSGALPHHPMMGKLLENRRNVKFKYEDGTLNLDTCGVYETQPFIDEGFHADNTVQRFENMTVFSSDFFHPYDYMSGKSLITDNTFSIHHFNGGWLDENSRSHREATLKIYNDTIDRIRGI